MFIKNAFKIFLAFLYLVTGIGYGSVQHTCFSQQNLMSAQESACCSQESVAELSKESDQAKLQPENNCCNEVTINLTNCICETRHSGDCCEFQHKYNQLDSSSLPLNIDSSQSVVISEQDYILSTQNLQNIPRLVLTHSSNPSFYINLPLLI